MSALSVASGSPSQTTFEVDIKRNSLGLGFSIMGGPEAPHPYTNLIRIKKVFPLQPAWECGQLRPGDVILKVDEASLVSLSLRQALDVLRTSRPLTRLTVFRPPENRLDRLASSAASSSVSNNNSEEPTPILSSGVVNRSYSCNINQDFAVSSSTKPGPSSIGLVPCSKRRPSRNSDVITDDVTMADCVDAAASDVLDESVQSFGSGRPVRLDSSESPDPEQQQNGNSDDLSKTWTYGMSQAFSLHQRMASDPVTNYPLKKQQPFGEFTVTLRKVNGSLGFAISQTVPDATVMRHSVKALVKEPAVSDGRIQPGDKLIAANGVQLANFSHAELIAFLRKCPDEVELKLYRDASRSQTPISPTGSAAAAGVATPGSGSGGIFAKSSKATQSHPNLPSFLHGRTTSSGGGGSGGKRLLRYEAKEMVRSLQASRTSLDSGNASRNASNASAGSSARIRRLGQPNRPYSPKNTKHPLLLSEVHSFDDETLGGGSSHSDFNNLISSSEPTVESPMVMPPADQSNPHIFTSDPHHSPQLPPDSMMERLRIEELPPTPPDGSSENFFHGETLQTTHPTMVVLPPPGAFHNDASDAGPQRPPAVPPKPRPRNLDLLANKRSHLYVFQGSETQ